jgi:hypothetical protein
MAVSHGRTYMAVHVTVSHWWQVLAAGVQIRSEQPEFDDPTDDGGRRAATVLNTVVYIINKGSVIAQPFQKSATITLPSTVRYPDQCNISMYSIFHAPCQRVKATPITFVCQEALAAVPSAEACGHLCRRFKKTIFMLYTCSRTKHFLLSVQEKPGQKTKFNLCL